MAVRDQAAIREKTVPSELADKYWEVGNAIVAFSVLQMLAFLYSLAKQDFREQIAKVFWWVVGAILASAIAYMAGVEVCYRAEMTLRTELTSTDSAAIVLGLTRWARLAIIGIYSLFGIGVLLFGKRHAWRLAKPR